MGKRDAKLAAGLVAGLVLAAGTALADEVEAPPVSVPDVPPAVMQSTSTLQPDLGSPEPFDGRTAREDWQDQRHWHYGTQQLFPLTRGMAEAGIPAPARWPLYLFTVPFDAGNLLFSAIGGLYGN